MALDLVSFDTVKVFLAFIYFAFMVEALRQCEQALVDSGNQPRRAGLRVILAAKVRAGQDFRVIEFALFAAILSGHQSRERIVGCGQAGRRTECPRAVARVSAGPRALDRRCAEGWESPHALET